MIKHFLFSKKFCGLSLFSFFLLIYIFTLCPTVFWWDSGEFIANISVLGIAHRPGFPIYILLGKVFSLIPFLSLALKVNLLSALFSAFSLLLFYFSFFEILELIKKPKISSLSPHPNPLPPGERESCESSSARMGIVRKKPDTLSASAFILVLGFTYSFWIQSVRAEVYSLNILFFALLLFLSLRHLKTRHIKYLYLFFFILGLGLGNHHLSLLSTTPALFFLLSSSSAIRRSSFVINLKRLILYLFSFLLGLSIYLYLPIRSFSNPPLAWGNTRSISGSASSVFATESLKNLNFDFFSNIGEKIFAMIYLFYDQLTLVCFLISLLGMVFLARHGKRALIFFLLLIMGNCGSVLFITTEFISTNPDLHGYLLFSLFSLAFSYGLGVFFLLDGLRNRSSIIRHSSFVILLVISFIPLSRHLTYANLSNNRIAYDYGYNTIHHLDSNSVLFVDNVNLNFILKELQYAEGIRKDVKIIDRGRLDFDWYADQKRKDLQDLFSGIPAQLSGDALFYAVLKKCLGQNVPTYMEFTEKDTNLVDHLIPSGYAFKLSNNRIEKIPDEILSRQEKWEKNEFFNLNDDNFQRDWDAQRVFALSFYRLGLFYEKRGLLSHALDRFEHIRKIDPYNEDLSAKIEALRKDQALWGSIDSN